MAVDAGVLLETLRHTVVFLLLDWREKVPLPLVVSHLEFEIRLALVESHFGGVDFIGDIHAIDAFFGQLGQNMLGVVELVGPFGSVEG